MKPESSAGKTQVLLDSDLSFMDERSARRRVGSARGVSRRAFVLPLKRSRGLIATALAGLGCPE